MSKNKEKEQTEIKDIEIVLSVKDRIIMKNIFPMETDLLTQIVIKDILEKIEITQDEIQEIEMVFVEEIRGYKWNDQKEQPKKVVFTKPELKTIKDSIDRLDREKKITQNILDLYIKLKDYI